MVEFHAPPRNTTTFIAPAEPPDLDTRYVFKLINIIDLGISNWYDPAKDTVPFHDLRWCFNVAPVGSRAPVLDVDGNPWEYTEKTTSKVGKAQRAGGRTATARLWMEALLGHAVEEEEAVSPTMAAGLIGKVATGIFEEVSRTNEQTGDVSTFLKILRLSPYKGGATKAEPKPEPKPVAVAAPADDDSSLPF